MRCVSSPKLQGLGFHSSALMYDYLRRGCSDQSLIQAHISLIRKDFGPDWVRSETISGAFLFFRFFNENCWLCQHAEKTEF